MRTETTFDVGAVLPQLRDNSEAMPWAERLDVAEQIGKRLATRAPTKADIEVLAVLAGDRKWQVRKSVAGLLRYLPDGDFSRLSVQLADDCNAFVCRAVERAQKLRKQSRQEAEIQRRGLEQVERRYASMERRFGRPAAEMARKIGRELHEHLVRSFIHDLSGVLTPVKASAAMLVKHSVTGTIDPVWLRESAERIVERIEFCQRLFDNMKAYAQKTPLDMHLERLSEIVRDARRMVADRIMTCDSSVRNVTLSVDVPEHCILSVARPWIAVALANVLHNAFDAYMVGQGRFAQGEILLQAVVEDAQVIITVRDTGRGIDEEALTELRRFIPGTTSKTDHGTGYGLPLAHRYVEAHGGKLTIDSQQNRGTTVTLTLPLEQL